MSSGNRNNIELEISPLDRLKTGTIQDNIGKPPDNIVDPTVFMALTLDDLSLKFSKLIDLFVKNQNTLDSLLQYTIKNEKRLASIETQLLEEADEAARLLLSGTVLTTQFTILDTDIDPGHPVKGYRVHNDGPNNLYITHNAALSSVGPDIIDVTSTNTIFELLQVNEVAEDSYNRQKIKNIYLLASGGNTSFRAKLVW